MTPGNWWEVKEWKKKAAPGSMQVVDRLYSQDLLYLKQLQKRGIDFVVRLRQNFIRTPQAPTEPLTPADVKAGVVSDRVQELGAGGGGPVLRPFALRWPRDAGPPTSLASPPPLSVPNRTAQSE
jgi:hypothetical protein